jgi:hypothetical protein
VAGRLHEGRFKSCRADGARGRPCPPCGFPLPTGRPGEKHLSPLPNATFRGTHEARSPGPEHAPKATASVGKRSPPRTANPRTALFHAHPFPWNLAAPGAFCPPRPLAETRTLVESRDILAPGLPHRGRPAPRSRQDLRGLPPIPVRPAENLDAPRGSRESLRRRAPDRHIRQPSPHTMIAR